LLAGSLLGCKRALAPADLPDAPEVLSTKVVFSPHCRRLLFSSNRNDHVGVFSIDPTSPARAVSALDLPRDRDLFVRSLSPDCGAVALVGDDAGNGKFDVFLYDISSRKLANLTQGGEGNEGEPEFAPAAPLLAYLSDRRLMLYDYRSQAPLSVPSPPVEFTALEWSADGRRIFLEDRATSIWEYGLAKGGFSQVWKAPTRSANPRMIHSYDHFLYFTSDHESEFSQIYELDLQSSRLRRVCPSPHDQYSPQRRGEDDLVFRTTIDGNVIALRLSSGLAEPISPSRGVVYDVSLDFPEPLLVYAGEQAISSIYSGDSRGVHDLLSHRLAVAQPPAQVVRTGEGMAHFVFAADSHPRQWVVWLHGGPHEQVSPRFNLYFDFLVRLGYGVVALNYPGSTGIGNAYELRGLSDSAQVARQLAGIDQELEQVAAQYPGFRRYVLIGVSYGAGLGFLHLRRHPDRVTRFVDFSGATPPATRVDSLGHPLGTPILLIQGDNDPEQQKPDRRALLRARGRWGTTRQVTLEGEGHFVQRLSSIRTILAELRDFLSAPAP